MASHRRLHDKTTAKQSGYTPPPSFNRQQATGNETTRNHTALVNAPQTSGYLTCLLHLPPSPGMRGQHSEPPHVTNERQKNRAASLRLAARQRQQSAALLGPTRIQDGVQVESDDLVGDDLFSGAGTHLGGLSNRTRRDGSRDTRDTTQVGVGVDNATTNAITRRVGGRGDRGDGPRASRSVCNLNGLWHLDVEHEGRNGTGLGCRLGTVSTRSGRRRSGRGGR